ncbi:TKL/TKL-ccin protein kinase, partial [Coprinopsis marcescibilis]
MYKDLTSHVSKKSESPIAIGGFSDIFLGECRLDESQAPIVVAVKVLRGVHLDGKVAQDKLMQRLYREAGLWHTLEHPNVLPFLGLVESSSQFTGGPALISRFCHNGTALDYVKNNPQTPRLPLIKGVAAGLQYLHHRDVVHGDLKSHNILMGDDGNPLLCDFGRSKLLTHRGFTTSFSGAYRYMSPELFYNAINGTEDDDYDPVTTKPSDIYALSLVCVEILSGLLVFSKVKIDAMIVGLVMGGQRPKLSDYTHLPSDAGHIWPLLEECWSSEPTDRPTIDAVAKRL